MKKPSIQGELGKVAGKMAFLSSIVISLIIAFWVLGYFKTTAENVYYLMFFFIESLINLTVPYLYISNTPNMNDFITNSINKLILSPIVLFMTSIIDSVFHFIMLLKPTPRIYPTID